MFLIPICAISTYAQIDSTKKELKFDLGITRDQNINLWPIFKRTFGEFESDKQVLFPVYRSYKNTLSGEKRSHLLPIYWRDSSKKEKNLRIISTFYPSIVHSSSNYKENTKTFSLLEFAPSVNILEFKKSPDGLVLQNNLLFFLWYKNNQITRKSYLVVFPAYWQFSSPMRKSNTLLPLYSYGKYAKHTKNYFAITPLMWHFNSPQQTSNLFIPLWWNKTTRINTDTVKTRLLLPIYYSHLSKNLKNNVIFPLVWSHKDLLYRSLTLAPIFSYGYSNNSSRSHLMLTPLFWNFRQNESKRTILFPILWKYKWQTQIEEYQTLVVFPVYWNSQTNDKKSTVIPPFIWNRSTPNYHSFSLIPLLSTGSSPNKLTSHLAISPIFWHFKTAYGYSNTFLPIWWYSKRKYDSYTKVDNIISPFYWGWKRQYHQGNIMFPVLWRFKNQNYCSTTIFPLLSLGKSSDGSRAYSTITPLYWRFKTPTGKGQLLFPLWFEKQRTVEGEVNSSSQVLLLYWRYNDRELKHQGIFPIAWRFKGQNRQSFTLFPIISTGKRKDNERRYLAVSPLFWRFKKPNTTFSTLFPLWWSRDDFNEEGKKSCKVLIPVYYSQIDSRYKRNVLFPIIWSFKNPNYNSFSFVPLFSYGKSPEKDKIHLTVTPLFWHFKSIDGSTSTILPIFWHSRYGLGKNVSEKTIVFPIFYYINNIAVSNGIVFPIIWNLDNMDYKSFTFAPFFSYGRNDDKSKSHYAITPLYYNIKGTNSKSRIIFPLWWNIKSTAHNGYSKTDVLFPIYWSFSNQSKNTKVFFPLIWIFNGSKSYSTTVFPLLSKGKSKNGLKHLGVTPLYWQFANSTMRRNILFPIFNSYSDINQNKKFDVLFFLFRKSKVGNDKSLSFIWPIIKREKGDDYRYFRFAPLVWSKKSTEFSYFTIQPFYYWSKSDNQITHRLFEELFVNRNLLGIRKSNSILWKFINWDKYNNGDKSFRVLHLLYANSNVNGETEKSLFPIYYLTKDDKGNKSLSVMLYFYNSLKRKIPNTDEFYQEERIFWLIRIRSNYRILKEKGISID